MAIGTDFDVDTSGNIRHVAGTSTYTVLELHRWLQDLADDPEASGTDLIDITTATPSERSTDQIITLNSPFNIDDSAAQYLYDGSITQEGGDVVYSGLTLVGSVVTGTEPMVVQDNKVLAPYWGTGVNADAASNTIMQIIIKTRDGGADIDGKKIRVMSRELNDSYGEFDVTLGLANSTAAIFTSDDLNNDKSSATLEGYTTIVNTEGWQEIDIDGTGSSGQAFYSQWDIGTQTKNDTYERTKWIQKRAEVVDSGTDTGTDYIVDDNDTTSLKRGQEFSANSFDEKLVEMRFDLKVGAGTPTGLMYAELWLSDDAATAAPTGSVLATSEGVDSSILLSTYQEIIFRFNDNVTMTGGEDYFAVITHPDGTATDYIEVDGAASGSDDGNMATYASAAWTGSAPDLQFSVKGSPIIHGIAGELFRGITTQFYYDTESGTFQEDEIVFWGTDITYDALAGGTFTVGEYVVFDNAGTWVNAGKVLYDNGTTNMIVALEDSSGGTLADGYNITNVAGDVSADIDTTILNQDKAGGEGIILALDDSPVSEGDIWIQRIHGSNPVDDLPIRGRTSSATGAIDTNTGSNPVESRTVSPEFIGQSTGSNIIGAYGIGFDKDDVGSSDTFFDLDNTQRTPPNNVTFTVSGLVDSQDYVLLGPRSAGTLNKAQYTTDTTLSGAGETEVSLTGAIQTETPSEGTTSDSRLRVELDSGIYKKQTYTSWSGSDFVIPSTSYSSDNSTSGNNVFVAYIDALAGATGELSFTAVHGTNRDLFLRVRDGGAASPIKTYEANVTFSGADQTVSVTRTPDA